MDDDELHIQLRTDTGRYRYIRRVPAAVAHLDDREFVRESLNTADREVAIARAKERDVELDEYWGSLLEAGSSASAWERSQAAGRLAQAMGFDALSAEQILDGDVDDLIARLLALAGREDDPLLVEALLGTAEAPSMKVSGLFQFYMSLKQAELVGYSPSQLRRHRQAKERAAQYLLTVIDDKPFPEITRMDALRFRGWWETKIATEGLSRDSANRSFADIQGMFVRDNRRGPADELPIHMDRPEDQGCSPKGQAAPQLHPRLRPGAHPGPTRPRQRALRCSHGLLRDGRDGRPAERDLQPHAGGEQGVGKTDPPHRHRGDGRANPEVRQYATRKIPLVGVSLWAMRQVPDCFPALRNNEDSYSAAIGKAFTRLGLRPTPEHTPYSIRHTFQDRILAAGASDRLQTDLMGHEFERVKYGEGPSLKQKLQMLDRIKFDWHLAAE